MAAGVKTREASSIIELLTASGNGVRSCKDKRKTPLVGQVKIAKSHVGNSQRHSECYGVCTVYTSMSAISCCRSP